MVNDMKLSLKMTLLFSVIMASAILILSAYTTQISLDGARRYTQSRFTNMSATISRDLEQEIRMMSLTLSELTGNTSFMAALNQFVRDDSKDQKVGNAARMAALQQLYQSPLVERFYRVSFISPNGLYITSLIDKDQEHPGTSEKLYRLYNSLGEIPPAGTDIPYYILSPQSDELSTRQDILVYGIVQQVYYRGNMLGYISILNEQSTLSHIMNFVDHVDEVEVQAVFDDGSLLFSSTGQVYPLPMDMQTGSMQEWTDPENNTQLEVLHTRIESLGLNLYIIQDSHFAALRNKELRTAIMRRALLIMLPAIALITLIAFGLTRSIRRLTKKVRQMPAESVLPGNPSTPQALMDVVTSSSNYEIHILEQTYNSMMLRLRENTLRELALREGALQAQLSALQAQINPHFIYNTLNIISAKSMESGNFDVIEICDQFASMLRYAMDTRSRTATMQDEIENVRNYLTLAKARYEQNLEYTIDVPDDLQDIKVPKLTLQPIVENALTHGYDGINVLRVLTITGKISGENLLLEVHDNGTGFSEEILQNLRQRIDDINAGKVSTEESNGHIGLLNTCLRLYYYSKGSIQMSIRNDNGAVITFSLPVSL